MIVVGVVGGIASGKSFVTQYLESLGAVVLDADRMGHQVLRLPSVKKILRAEWGGQIFDATGEVDRSKLAQIVFDPQQPERLQKLEAITHPTIKEKLQAELEQLRESGKVKVLVMDAPVMVKAGWYVLCDVIIFVDTSPSNRLNRVLQRGWTETMLRNREAMQTPVESKRRISTHVLDNNGTKEQATCQLNKIWSQIQKGADSSE